jgi:hypothetical protein
MPPGIADLALLITEEIPTVSKYGRFCCFRTDEVKGHRRGASALKEIVARYPAHSAIEVAVPPVAMLPDRRFSNGSRPQSVNIAQYRSIALANGIIVLMGFSLARP